MRVLSLKPTIDAGLKYYIKNGSDQFRNFTLHDLTDSLLDPVVMNNKLCPLTTFRGDGWTFGTYEGTCMSEFNQHLSSNGSATPGHIRPSDHAVVPLQCGCNVPVA